MAEGVSGSVPVFVVKEVCWRVFNTITITVVNFNREIVAAPYCISVKRNHQRLLVQRPGV